MKQIISSILVITILSSVFFNCATMLNSKGNNISFNSNPNGAEVLVDGELVGKTPLEININRKKMHNITIRKDGKEKTFVLDKKVISNWIILDLGLAIGWIILSMKYSDEILNKMDFLAFLYFMDIGFVSFIIDGIFGSWYNLSPQEINVEFE